MVVDTVTPVDAGPTPSGHMVLHAIRVRICYSHSVASGQMWSVKDIDTGETLISAARDPEHAVCRHLLAKGIVGWIQTYVGDRQYPSFTYDIEVTAQYGVRESAKEGPKTMKWFARDFPGSKDETDD